MSTSTAARPRALCVLAQDDLCELVTLVLPHFEITSVKSIQEATTDRNRSASFILLICAAALIEHEAGESCRRLRAAYASTPIILLCAPSELTALELTASGGNRLVSFDHSNWPDDLCSAVRELTGISAAPA